jgi:hypothetical protein
MDCCTIQIAMKRILYIFILLSGLSARGQVLTRYLNTANEKTIARGQFGVDSASYVPADTIMRASWDKTKPAIAVKSGIHYIWSVSAQKWIRSGVTDWADLTGKPTEFTPSSGSSYYIQNQTASAQTANFWISGNGKLGGNLYTLGGYIYGSDGSGGSGTLAKVFVNDDNGSFLQYDNSYVGIGGNVINLQVDNSVRAILTSSLFTTSNRFLVTNTAGYTDDLSTTLQVWGPSYYKGIARFDTSITLANLSSAPGGSNGRMYYNTTTNQFQGYRNGAWKNYLMEGDDQHGGNTDITFTANRTWNANSKLLYIDNLLGFRLGGVTNDNSHIMTYQMNNSGQFLFGLVGNIAGNTGVFTVAEKNSFNPRAGFYSVDPDGLRNYVYTYKDSLVLHVKNTSTPLKILNLPAGSSTDYQLTYDNTNSKVTKREARDGNTLKSGDGSTNSFTIAHGLSGTPSYIDVDAGSTDAKGFDYIEADGTNITIHYSTAPTTGTNNLKFYWQAKL